MSVLDLTSQTLSGPEKKYNGNQNTTQDNKAVPEETEYEEYSGEKNITDPKVCHDPTIQLEGIARWYANQNKVMMEEKELSEKNEYDATKLDGILYPLVVINDRIVEKDDILSMTINYDKFLPEIMIKIFDEHCTEQNINTTQMSGMIRLCMISPVDKIYKKILLNFQITNTIPDNYNRQIVTYIGEYNVDGFKSVNTMHIWMEDVCTNNTCNQGGHVNANTWEMLHKIAELTGLGFAATKQCKEVNDNAIRHIYTQRFNYYIMQQLLHSGTDENNIFDAWVDLYGYIVMVNVPWILKQDINPQSLTLTANVGLHGTSNDTLDEKPQTVVRTLTNYNNMGIRSNMEIQSYNIEVDNNVVNRGTLERIYSIKFVEGKSNVKIDTVDLQTKQNSTDGEHLEDYNTGKSRPIPKFDFNSPEYTGFENGYDINKQKTIRNAYFKKLKQSVLYVKLRNIYFGLQRGTLVNIAIFDNDPVNKDIILKNGSRLFRTDGDIEQDKLKLPQEAPEHDLIIDSDMYLPNAKLSGLYYIDGMKFEYSQETGKIDQTLKLLKKGITTGYYNRHTPFGVPRDEYPGKQTLPQDTNGKLLEDIV